MPDYWLEGLLLLVLSAAYFWLTRGGGKLVYLMAALIYVVLMIANNDYRWFVIALFAGLVFYLSDRAGRGTGTYKSALSRFEGGGIKRGLTAPEAALVLGKPFNFTITLVLVDMLKKGFIQIVSERDLAFELAPVFRSESLNSQARIELRRKAALDMGQVLQSYEDPFLEIIGQHSGGPVYEYDFTILVRPFVQHVAGRVGGFDLEETRNYYRLIAERAPKEARTDGVLVADSERVLGHNALWVLFNENYPQVFAQPEFIFKPYWGPQEVPFIPWVTELIDKLQSSISADALQLRLGKDVDALSATLMDEIANATYYG